ncbi:MAG: hypothetical protein ACYTG0_04115 [Planctomycetota bacterium]|jgi:hypothetical protein
MTVMFIPQYSIRWLLAVTVFCAVAFSIVGLAVRGSHWAAAVSIALASLVIVVLVYALMFAVAWIGASIAPSLQGESSASGAPPQGQRMAAGVGSADGAEELDTPIFLDDSPSAPERP